MRDGLLGETADPGEEERRRTYQLTPLGRSVESQEANRLRSLLATAQERGLLTARVDELIAPPVHTRRWTAAVTSLVPTRCTGAWRQTAPWRRMRSC